MVTSKLLQSIKVVVCIDHVIYGIPYKMREGQNPKDILSRYRNDWIYLRNMSGFYGDKTAEEVQAVKEFLAFTGTPDYDGNWFDVDWTCPACGEEGWLIPFYEDGLYMSGCMYCKAETSNRSQLSVNKTMIENNNWPKPLGISKL